MVTVNPIVIAALLPLVAHQAIIVGTIYTQCMLMHQTRIKPINIYKMTHHLLVALSLLVLSSVPHVKPQPQSKVKYT